MKQYIKLCGYFAEWMWKPFYRIVIAVSILEMVVAIERAEWCSHYTALLDEMAFRICGWGAVVLFLFFAWRCFHQLFGAHRGIYTIAALPAPGWAFPAAAYTVTAAGILVMNALQLVLAFAAYLPFCMRHGTGEDLYLAVLRAECFQSLLPHTPEQAAKAMMYFSFSVLLPFTTMTGSFRKHRRTGGLSADNISTSQAVILLLMVAYEFVMPFVFDNDPMVRYLFWDILISIALALDLRGWAVRPGQIEAL